MKQLYYITYFKIPISVCAALVECEHAFLLFKCSRVIFSGRVFILNSVSFHYNNIMGAATEAGNTVYSFP